MAAMTALTNIQMRKDESWLAATTRLVQYFRAAKLTTDTPYWAEEEYFWQLITSEDLFTLMEKTVELFFPQIGDQLPRQAYLIILRDQFDPNLRNMPILRHQLASPAMTLRGDATKAIYHELVSSMTRDASKYLSPDTSKDQPQQLTAGDGLHFALSRKIPTSARLNPYDFSRVGTKKASPSLVALTPSSMSDMHPADIFAALASSFKTDSKYSDRPNNQLKRHRDNTENSEEPPSSRPRYTERGRKSRQERTQPLASPSTATPASLKPSSGGSAGRTYKRPPTRELPSEAPRPGGDEREIRQYILNTKSCFFHARGEPCPNMKEFQWCQYSHDLLPWGIYPKQPRPQDHKSAMAAIHSEQQEHDDTIPVGLHSQDSEGSDLDSGSAQDSHQSSHRADSLATGTHSHDC